MDVQLLLAWLIVLLAEIELVWIKSDNNIFNGFNLIIIGIALVRIGMILTGG